MVKDAQGGASLSRKRRKSIFTRLRSRTEKVKEVVISSDLDLNMEKRSTLVTSASWTLYI